MKTSIYKNFEPKIVEDDLEGNPQTPADVSEIEAIQISLGKGLPESYKGFLSQRNGYLGWIGKNYVRFYPTHKLESENDPSWNEFFPNMLRIGDTGALENFVINYKFSPPRFGLLPSIGSESDFILLGIEWEQLVERLVNDTLFERDLICIRINNSVISVQEGTTVAAAILACGTDVFRRSVSGTPRGPLCGMGICFECRLTIDGVRLQRSCNILAADGMEVVTDE